MKRDFLIGVPVVVVAIALGVGAAFGASQLINNATASSSRTVTPKTNGTTRLPALPQPNGRNNGNGRGGFGIPNLPNTPNGNEIGPGGNEGWFGFFGTGPGMMQYGYRGNSQQQTGQRITIDQATQDAQAYANKVGANLTVADMLEFQNGFYAIVTENDTGRGAFELQINPYTGNVSRGAGPDLSWNLKYGRVQMNNTTDNTITLEQAQSDAQKTLDARVSGATLGSIEYSFYGYYTFDYQVNGKITGLLSVNGINGQVWLDNRLGTFISEKEVGK